jgi:hypothetical protein
MRERFFVVIILVTASLSAHAGTCHWGTSGGDWMNSVMWWDDAISAHRIPGPNDTALFYTNAIASLGANENASIKLLYLGEFCRTGLPAHSVSTLVINGSLTASDVSTVGNNGTGSNTLRGLLIINQGGSFTEKTGLLVGSTDNGTVIMNGGSLSSTAYISLGCKPWRNDDVNTPGIGSMELNAGTVQTNQLYMGSDASQIVIANGVLEVNILAGIPFYLANNQIVAANGYTLNVDNTFNMGFGVRISAIGPMKGDMNGDKKINFKDFALFARSWADGI